MNRMAKWFWVVVALQAVVLLTWAGYHEAVRQHATAILLRGRPVDPQDLMRGDYMILGYDIGTVKKDTDELRKLRIGADVWVLLEPRGKYHEIALASATRPTPGPNQLVVKGSVGPNWRSQADVLAIRYGIEEFFVPEGKGTPRFELMEIEASVSPARRLYIRRVLLDGKAYP